MNNKYACSKTDTYIPPPFLTEDLSSATYMHSTEPKRRKLDVPKRIRLPAKKELENNSISLILGLWHSLKWKCDAEKVVIVTQLLWNSYGVPTLMELVRNSFPI